MSGIVRHIIKTEILESYNNNTTLLHYICKQKSKGRQTHVCSAAYSV